MPLATLDASTDRRHVLDPDRKDNRESGVWVVTIPERRLGFVAYTWVNAFGRAGVAGIAFGPDLASPVFERVDDVPVPDDMGFDDWRAGPMRFAMREPQGTTTVSYAGERLAMEFEFEVFHPPYSYASHPEPFPTFYADDRLEQGGRATGTVTIDGEETRFSAFAHRDHSWGARTWGGTLHYKWMNFLADDASVHVMDLHGFGRTTTRGYVHRDGVTAQIVESDFDFDLDDDFFHRRLAATFVDDTGRSTTVRLTSSDAELTYPISPTLQLVDIVGTCEIEGRPGASYAEMAWPPDYLVNNSAG